MKMLDDVALERVAAYFGALAVPLRLKMLNALREHERTVGELTDLCGCSQANVSKHLAVLSLSGLVRKTARGTSVIYRIADRDIYTLCDLVCGQIGRRFAEEAAVLRMFDGAGGNGTRKMRNKRNS